MNDTITLNKDMSEIYHTEVPAVELKEGSTSSSQYCYYYVNGDESLVIDRLNEERTAPGEILSMLEKLDCKVIFFDGEELHLLIHEWKKEEVIEFLSSYNRDIV